jgi:cytochrome c-type biogenesis protein CcmE
MGALVHGSLERRESPCEYRFRVQTNNVEMPVSFKQCVVPDNFKDLPGMDLNVTIEGKILADSSFEATTVFAQCPSKYEMRDRASKGEKAPHTAMPSM